MASLIFERISSSSSSSSYSSSTHGRKYDVFLSFSGEEPRHDFTDHLYEELRRKRIHVCRDDEKLQGGEVVALELMKAIEESQYAIVVLSEKFADSKRCLDELAKIVECREKRGLSIFPVFDHVDPSDVHNQKGPFETVFAKHETDDSVTIEKKQKWMDALRDVSNISGWCLHDRSESTVIQNIVERMHSELYGEFESVSKDLVGMESSIEGVINLLDKGSDDVRFIGIWGCGGVGKTTLAQVIYCKISNQFDSKSFICFGSVGQTKNDYLVPIQKLLLSNIFATRELNITSVHEGKKVIKQMLCSRKVLIVLDNVNDKGQLDAIAESRDWFGAGSRLIITSRDKQLLTSYNVDMYEAKTLDNDKALELFSQKAFKQPHPKKDFVDLSNDIVKYAQGLPLFLEVFGSSLHKEGIDVWKIFLDQLNENSSGEIMERLEISYKRILDQKAKELFLDIAFFFKGMDKNRVAKILNDPSFWENIDILKEKSLITILGRKIWMHDLLQEMGREIVRREAPQEPGIRSRLWHYKDIFSILKNNTGTKRVEGMMLNCPPNKEDLNANCFSEMTRLRLINICNVLLPHGLNYLSNELQMMEWNDYPLKFMPRNFRPNNLVELIMHHSHIEQLPEEFTSLDQLKLMDLSYSQNLIKTPDFIGFRNLERLIFQGCTRLYKVQPLVVALRWLTLLNLKDCKHLKCLPYEIDLESLEIFILSGCSRLKKFSEIGRNMTRLSELYLDGTAIEELPPSIKHLTGLTLLNLKDCNDLLSFPSVICSLTSLEILTLSGCRGQPRKPLHLLGLSPMSSSIGVNLTFKGTILLLIMSFLVLPYNYLSIFVCATLILWTYCFLNARYPVPEPINLLLPKSFSGLSSLKSLDLSDCNLSDGALPEDLSCLSSLRFLNLGKNNFTFLPDSISQLSKLKLLCLDNCSNLQSLPYLPSSTNFVMARGCTSLENYSKKVVWTSGETGFTFINCLSLVEEEDKITEVSLLGSLLEDEGSKRTEVSLLDIHFQPLWQRYMEDQIRESEGFCCLLPQSEITEWFKNQNCGSYVSIPLHRYNISLRGIALCVDFEVHKNSNEVSLGQDAKFICRLYMDGAPIDPIVYTVPRDKIYVGSFGIWLYISHKRIREVDQCDCIRPLIRTNSADVEIKGCGARILYESDVVEFVQNLSQNIFGSPDDLRRPSEDIIKCRDDKVESSQSNALIESSPRLSSALWSLLSRLYEGDHARHHYYDYIFPQIAIPRDWFSYQNLESYIKMELPPNLQDNSTWMGFTIFASYTVDKQRAGWSYEQNSTIFLHFYSFSASDEVPLAPYIAFPLSRDVFDESSRRLLVFYIPRARFQLNCFSHIWASFGSNNPVVKVEMCGIRIVYEQDDEQFVQTLVQCMLEIPVAYHPSLYQNLLHQLALLQDCNHERGFCSSCLSERRPQTMPKLLRTYEIVAEEDCTSPENQVIAMSSGNSSPFTGTEVVEGMVLNSPLHKENLNDKAFSNMKSLRLLKIANVHLPTGLNFLSNKLGMMEWHDYPLKFMPISFQPDNLEELIMPRGHIEQFPEGLPNLAKLRLLDLRDSKVLVKTPNFIGCSNLERLNFQGCTSLYELHPSVGALNKLTLLNLKDCRSLTGLPCEINLKSLEIFIISGCSSLNKFSEIGTNMTSLSELYLDGTAVEELPSSLERLTGLTVLSLQGCKNLSSFPSVNLLSLKTLNLSGFKVQPPKSWLSHRFSLVRAARVFFQGFFPIGEAINLLLPRLRFIVSLNLADRNLWDGGLPDDLSGLSSLQELDLSKNNFTRLPDSISQLSKLKSLTLNDCSRLQSLPDLPLSIGFVTARRCPLLEKYSNQFVVWTSGETGFTVVDCEERIAPTRISSIPKNDFDPFFERFLEGCVHQNKISRLFSNSTETPRWFSHQSPGSSVTIPLLSNLRGDSNWMGIALFIRVVILEDLNNVSSGRDDEVSIDFICRSDIIEGPCISCGHINITESLSKAVNGPLSYASSYGMKLLIPAGKLRDHLKDCSCISAFIRKKCTYIEIETCGARELYKQDLVKFIRAEGKMKQRSKCYLDDKVECSRLCQELIHQNKNSLLEFSNLTKIPEWFIHQNLGSSIRMPLTLDLHDNSSWIGIALFAVVVVHKNLNSKDYKVSIDYSCGLDMVEGPVDRHPLVFDISKFLPNRFRHASSFSFKFLVRARQLRDHLKECSWISTLITSDSPYVQIKMCGARGVYNKQDLEKFVQAEGEIKQRTKCQMDKVESSQSNDRLKEKLMSLLLTVYKGDLARNHKYDYVFPHMSVPVWFRNRSFCSDIRIKLPTNLQHDGRWMGIAVCAYYTVKERPAISGDNKDLTSFLNFYNPLVSHRVCLTRHRVFQESKDIFVDSSHKILVFYIPHVLLRLEECRHIGASFEHNEPDVVQVKECGLRLVYEQDVEKFVQTLAQCMLESPDAECFYQNLLHQVEERVASKDFGFSSSLQRMPQPMPVLQPSIENIAEGCTSSATSPSSFTGFLVTTRKEQYASIMSSESLIKARLEKNFDEGEIFNCCFAEREIPLWFCYKSERSMKIPLAPECVNDPDWMGFALCGLFSFNLHPTVVRQHQNLGSIDIFISRCFIQTSSCYQRLVCHGILTMDNELVTLDQRGFIWVMFIPRTTHAHLWSKSAWVQFLLDSVEPHLSVESFGVNLVFRHNMEELTQLLVQRSAPFGSFLDSRDPRVFCNVWDNYPEFFLGRKNSYEELHPQRLFISQEETSVTAQYSYAEDSYPHNRFRCFHPSTLYNSCFPTRRTPRWFNHHCRLGHSVTIEIPPNLYEENNWLGLALYASILIPRDQENAVSANSSHFLYCQFQTSKASLDNQILVCRTTIEEHNWLHKLFGLVWISYIPSEALKDMLHQCGHIKATFVSDWPSVTVQKCGLRLLYQHDRLQFEQQLERCNVFISAQRDFTCQINRHGTMLELMEECMPMADKVIRSLFNKYDPLRFDGHSKYSYCFPPVEISRYLTYFNYQSNEPSVKIDLSNDSKWMGLVLYAYFSSDKHQTTIIENPNSSISQRLICILETDVAGPEPGIYVHRTIGEEFTWLDIEGGFLWLCYIPSWMLLDRFNQCSCIKASIKSDWPGIIVQKCGLGFYRVHHNWFQEIRNHCNMQYADQDFFDQLTASYIAKTSRAKNQLSESHLPGFDRSCDYNSCCPPKIPHWFSIQRDESHVTVCLTRKLHNGSTCMGVALCALFSVRKDVANLNDIMDSKSSYKLICHLEASNGLSVKPRHIYWPTKEDLMMSLLGGFTWLTYISCGSFPDWLYDCASIKFSFMTNCLGLKVQKCGLRLLDQNSVENFKKCMNTKFDISGILNQKKIENRNRKMRHLIQTGLSKNDPRGFDRCIFFIPQMPSSEILEWFNHRSDEPWLTITLPPNLYNDSTWMGLVLCAYFAIDVNLTAHFDILDLDTSPGLICHLETNVGGMGPLLGHYLTKEDLVMLQQGECILLSYRGRNCLNQVNCIKASFITDCPGLKVEKCGFRLLYRNELEESEQMNSPSGDLEEFEQTISHSMNSSLDDWDIIRQLTTDDVNRDKQKHDDEGISSRTSSSRKESNFGSQRGPIDPKDKGKRVLEE